MQNGYKSYYPGIGIIFTQPENKNFNPCLFGVLLLLSEEFSYIYFTYLLFYAYLLKCIKSG